jgi:hypothetical protein
VVKELANWVLRGIIPSAIMTGALTEWQHLYHTAGIVTGTQKASVTSALASHKCYEPALARLAGGAQAFGTELQLNRNAAIERKRRLLNVWLPHAAGKIVSVANVVAKRGFFAAELTLCHGKTNLLDQRRALRNTIVTLSLDYTIFGASWQTHARLLIVGKTDEYHQ